MADMETAQRNGNKGTAKFAIAPSLAENVIYADGVQALAIKGGVGQIDLYQLLAATANDESRVVSHRVVLPLPAALTELLRMLGTAAQAGAAARGRTAGKKQ